ncbi:MAG: type II toxin-antitoxin system RelE/ParE family toxin [bacterium]|nr:type II toxin-antitoxin system RelE/ParE family toxin [bacterium]MBU1916989.1 type II toxin-antitoxin system RelE/ParE family toxin [bacterium]
MAKFSVVFTKSAHKEFKGLSKNIQKKIIENLDTLAVNPFSDLLRIKKLRGAKDLYRFRVGDYRVVYEVNNSVMTVLVIKIGHRKEIYRKF